jgi:uncharacterized protein (TIGR00369 family)
MSIPFSVHVPFVDHLGFTLMRSEDGQSELHYTPQPEHLNSFSVTHGGASMTLMDVTMASAARSVQPDMGVVTIEMKTTFMRAAKGTLVARGHLMQRTATLAFTEAHLYDSEEKLCAHATGTFKYVRRLPVGGRNTHALNVISTD